MRRNAALFVLALPLAACGGALDEEEARAMWGSVEQSLGAGRSGGNTISQPLSVDVEFEVDCRRGGEASFDGDFNAGDDAAYGVATFEYHVVYDACAPDENTLDGEVDYVAALDAEVGDGSAEMQLVYRWSGSLVVTGESEGACDFDVTGSVSSSSALSDDSFTSDTEVVYQGYLCGHDAEDVLDERYESHVSVDL